MAGEVKLIYTISTKTYELVQAGQAMLSSGGVRTLEGKLLELAKPAAVAADSFSAMNPLGIFNLGSSIIGNIQMGFVQNSVNNANRTLAMTIQKLDMLHNVVTTVSALSWLNCAIGMLNCGVSIAGFKMTLDKLDDVKRQIEFISDKIDYEVAQSIKRRFNEFRLYINSDLDALERGALTDAEKTRISEHIDKMIAFLMDVIDRFEKHKINGELACNVIFNLVIAFSQVVREYSAQYYYEYGKMPANYNEWIALINRIQSASYKERLKEYLILDTDTRMEEKYLAFGGAMYALDNKLDEFDFTKELIHRISLDQYQNQDRLIMENIEKGNIFELDDNVGIVVA